MEEEKKSQQNTKRKTLCWRWGTGRKTSFSPLFHSRSQRSITSFAMSGRKQVAGAFSVNSSEEREEIDAGLRQELDAQLRIIEEGEEDKDNDNHDEDHSRPLLRSTNSLSSSSSPSSPSSNPFSEAAAEAESKQPPRSIWRPYWQLLRHNSSYRFSYFGNLISRFGDLINYIATVCVFSQHPPLSSLSPFIP